MHRAPRTRQVVTFRRVLHHRAHALIDKGWNAAARHHDAIGVDPFADYTQGSVLLWTEGEAMDTETPAIERIASMLVGIGPDELRVIELIVRRMRHGREHYGPLDVHTDRKDWMREASEELLDAVAYLAMEVTRKGEPR